MNLIPDEYQSDGHSTPVLIYPYERTRAALDSMAQGRQAASGARLPAALRQSGDRQASVPDHGGVDAAAAEGIFRQDLSLDRQRGVRGASRRRGTAQIGDKTFTIAPHDVFVVPPWQPYSFTADSEIELFSYSDRAGQEALGYWREQIG